MQSYIETLGRLIASQVAPHPRRARRMLTAAYSWVRFSGKRKKLTDAKSAYARMNGRVADTLIRGMNQPQQAVMVNIFMPCELMHAMGLTPMFPEGLWFTSPARPASMSLPNTRKLPAFRRASALTTRR